MPRRNGRSRPTANGRTIRLILMGHADALLELGRWEEALTRLEQLRKQGREGETPQVALAFRPRL
jgi:hypothetical protein